FNAVQPSLHSIYSSFVDIAGQNRVTVSTKKNLAEKYKDSYVAYKNGRLSHIFDPDYDNPDDYHLEPLKSKFRGLTAHIVGSLHQNVRHSTGDTDTTTPGPTYDAWIDFWLAHTGTAVKPVCCYFTGVLGANGHTCNATVAGSWLCFGNHTVASTVANTVVDPRTNGVVYIMPACNASNQWRNTNIFTLQVPTTSADLDDYHN
ncbi:MAG: hypothetical protein LBM93_06120, partial [Oscillospiraceae bacterium]|nr:hypothetical protein [Oscillospiraceae bacterium]